MFWRTLYYYWDFICTTTVVPPCYCCCCYYWIRLVGWAYSRGYGSLSRGALSFSKYIRLGILDTTQSRHQRRYYNTNNNNNDDDDNNNNNVCWSGAETWPKTVVGDSCTRRARKIHPQPRAGDVSSLELSSDGPRRSIYSNNLTNTGTRELWEREREWERCLPTYYCYYYNHRTPTANTKIAGKINDKSPVDK